MSERIKMRVSEYRRKFFSPESAPDPRTVIARIRDGEIIGEQIGRLWYVYPYEKPTPQQRVARVISEFEADLL